MNWLNEREYRHRRLSCFSKGGALIWVDVELLQSGIMFLTAMKQLERLMELKYYRGLPESTDYQNHLTQVLLI